jgi:putative phosphoribosyl transferase
MRAAIEIIQQQAPKCLIIAVPVAPAPTSAALQHSVDKIVCLLTPEPFYAIGLWYDDFTQTSDAQVRELLDQSVKFPLTQRAS